MGFIPAVAACLCILAGIPVTSALVWTSADHLPDNVTLATCEGQKVTLHWQYNRSHVEHPNDEEWHFVQEGGNSDSILAARVQGQFIPEAGNTVQLQFIPNAGIRLLNVTAQNSGLYSVRATFNVHGSLVTHTQTAHVHVIANADVVENGHLVATVQPGAKLDNHTNDYHLVLACSKINEPWRVSAQILWTTPSHKVLQTSWWDHGVAYLSVPNPVASGDYTCSLDNNNNNTSPALPATCLTPPQPPAQKGATVHVDGMEARLSLLEGELRDMSSRESELEGKIGGLEAENQALKQQLEFASQSVSFDVNLQTLTTSDSPLHFTDVTTNEGDAFNVRSGQFVTPVNGTYVFHLTLVSSNPEVDDDDVTVFLVVDGRKVASAMTSRVTGYYNTGSVDVVKPLARGQRVWVVNGSNGQRHFMFSVYLSGILVKAGM